MIKIGGVVYRNIQEQVAKNTQDIAKIQRRPVLQVKKVDELPEEGEEGILYLLPASDPETGNYFEEYLWIDSAWELIGSSAVDISNMLTTDTDQTITGVKTAQQIDFLNENGTVTWSVFANTVNGLEIRRNGVPRLQFTTSDTVTYTTRPYTDNTSDLGTSARRWKDIYLSGNVNISGTNVFVVDNVVINNSLVITSPSGSTITESILPRYNNSYRLGSSTNMWKDIYLSGQAIFGNSTNFVQFSSGSGKLYSNIGILVNGDVQLQNGNLTDGTNSSSVADIAALITYAKAQGWIS